MSTKYYMDNEGDLWKERNGDFWFLFLNAERKTNPYYRTWVKINSNFIAIQLRYKIVPITEEQVFVELL